MGITTPSKECDGPALLPAEVEIAAVYGIRTEPTPTGVTRLFVSVDPRSLACDDKGVGYIVLASDAGEHARSMHLIRRDAQRLDEKVVAWRAQAESAEAALLEAQRTTETLKVHVGELEQIVRQLSEPKATTIHAQSVDFSVADFRAQQAGRSEGLPSLDRVGRT